MFAASQFAGIALCMGILSVPVIFIAYWVWKEKI